MLELQRPNSQYLWRFMGLEKLPILLMGGLWFSRIDQFHNTDPLEGSIPKTTYGLFNRFPYAAEYLQEEFAQLPYVSYAVCWHMSDGEPDPILWDEFCPNGYGIAIRTTPGDVESAIEPLNALNNNGGPFYLSEVQYVDHNTHKLPEKNFMEPLFIVRNEFAHENEARLLAYISGCNVNNFLVTHGPFGPLLQTNPGARTNRLSGLRYTGGHNDGKAIVIPIQPETFIHEVIFAPQMQLKIKQQVTVKLSEYGLSNKIRK